MSLECRAVTVAYGDRTVLADVSCSVPAGQVTALFGPNGVGKTTLFRALLGQVPLVGGSVEMDGLDTSRWTPLQRARRLAYVPQQDAPTFPYSVFEVVLMGRNPHTHSMFGPRAEDEEAAVAALSQVGLLERAGDDYGTLSGGQRQLTLLARAIAQGSDCYLLDEPTASLDFHNQLVVWRAVQDLASMGKGVLVCTHDPNHALWFCDRAVVLDRPGVLVGEGAVVDILDESCISRLYPGAATIEQVGHRVAVLPVGWSGRVEAPVQG